METTFLMAEFMTKPVWMWLAFMTVVIALLVLDLGVLHRKTHEIEIKEKRKEKCRQENEQMKGT